MELKVKREEFTNDLQLHDIVYAALEANDPQFLLEMIYNVRDEERSNLEREIFLNASVELKQALRNFETKESSVNFNKYDLNAEPKHTYSFAKRAFDKKEPYILHLYGNAFTHLEEAILGTTSPRIILDFARHYKVDDASFLKELSKHGEIYEKAYRRDVMKDYRYQKDEMQLYV